MVCNTAALCRGSVGGLIISKELSVSANLLMAKQKANQVILIWHPEYIPHCNLIAADALFDSKKMSSCWLVITLVRLKRRKEDGWKERGRGGWEGGRVMKPEEGRQGVRCISLRLPSPFLPYLLISFVTLTTRVPKSPSQWQLTFWLSSLAIHVCM